nr:MAG TPA: hypothetical protein [Caudoviricetes sp.]
MYAFRVVRLTLAYALIAPALFMILFDSFSLCFSIFWLCL